MSSTLMLLMLLHIIAAVAFAIVFVSQCVLYGTPPTDRERQANRGH
jgi:hypothetical protein